MSKKELTSSFCSILKDFLQDMYSSYPDTSLLMLQQITNTMIMTHPDGVVVNFMLCVEKYVDKISIRDESFFLNGGLEKDLASGDYSFLLDELKKIAVIWRNPETSNKTKDSIWKYLQVLVKIGKKISNL